MIGYIKRKWRERKARQQVKAQRRHLEQQAQLHKPLNEVKESDLKKEIKAEFKRLDGILPGIHREADRTLIRRITIPNKATIAAHVEQIFGDLFQRTMIAAGGKDGADQIKVRDGKTLKAAKKAREIAKPKVTLSRTRKMKVAVATAASGTGTKLVMDAFMQRHISRSFADSTVGQSLSVGLSACVSIVTGTLVHHEQIQKTKEEQKQAEDSAPKAFDYDEADLTPFIRQLPNKQIDIILLLAQVQYEYIYNIEHKYIPTATRLLFRQQMVQAVIALTNSFAKDVNKVVDRQQSLWQRFKNLFKGKERLDPRQMQERIFRSLYDINMRCVELRRNEWLHATADFLNTYGVYFFFLGPLLTLIGRACNGLLEMIFQTSALFVYTAAKRVELAEEAKQFLCLADRIKALRAQDAARPTEAFKKTLPKVIKCARQSILIGSPDVWKTAYLTHAPRGEKGDKALRRKVQTLTIAAHKQTVSLIKDRSQITAFIDKMTAFLPMHEEHKVEQKAPFDLDVTEILPKMRAQVLEIIRGWGTAAGSREDIERSEEYRRLTRFYQYQLHGELVDCNRALYLDIKLTKEQIEFILNTIKMNPGTLLGSSVYLLAMLSPVEIGLGNHEIINQAAIQSIQQIDDLNQCLQLTKNVLQALFERDLNVFRVYRNIVIKQLAEIYPISDPIDQSRILGFLSNQLGVSTELFDDICVMHFAIGEFNTDMMTILIEAFQSERTLQYHEAKMEARKLLQGSEQWQQVQAKRATLPPREMHVTVQFGPKTATDEPLPSPGKSPATLPELDDVVTSAATKYGGMYGDGGSLKHLNLTDTAAADNDSDDEDRPLLRMSGLGGQTGTS